MISSSMNFSVLAKVIVGQSESKIEAIMNDFIKLKPQSNVFEAESILKMRKERRCLSPLLIKVTEMMKMEIKLIQRQNEKLRDHRRRELNLELAKERLKEGNVGAAIDYFQKAVHITPAMAHELIQILRSERVEFIVAPYEADAQLAYLSNLDPEHGIIFKMDRYGNGEEFLMDKVLNNLSEGLSFRHFDKELFIVTLQVTSLVKWKEAAWNSSLEHLCSL